ncbi:rod shape-determining protein [Flavobacterium dauae]|uniref:Ppx/GppA phosphatase family protein n=1 Tax=Flavobacterium dauae TaxID=1563479 RepID=UPI00101DF79A|nr:rod shape-determining protein [Flavobacterium dauae]WLD22643.1 rod shape-determining protein [Flavobacterium dauae]
MMKIKKYAAIDIGSNAMRLLISNVIEEENKPTQFNKSHLIRVPIRLGQDAFTVGEISEENATRMVKAMKAFKLLMDVYKVEKYAACATSAMREAYNGNELVKEIASKTGVKIDIIEGKTEAAIIANSDLESFIKKDGHYLYVDVGGGSTEFTVFSNGKQIVSKSFKNGTVRLLNNMVTQSVWEEIEKWIKIHTQDLDDLEIIGSGGNINKIFKMSGKVNSKPLTQSYLNQRFKYLNSLSYEERIATLGLNTDRADVIIPAIKIYVNAMKWSNAKYIYVPKIGLSDGIVKAMYYKNTKINVNKIL